MMMRRALALLTLLSLLLFLGTCILWARSYRHVDLLVHPRGMSDRLLIDSEFGLLVVEVESPQPARIQRDWVYFDSPLPRRWNSPHGLAGFWIYRGSVRHYLLLPPTPLWGITVPHAGLAVTTAILPLAFLLRWRRLLLRKLRLATGRCPTCGYDLRATPDRCPECGSERYS